MKAPINHIANLATGYQTRKAVQPEGLGTHFLLQIRDFNQERTALNLGNMIKFTPTSSGKDQVLRAGDVVFLSRGQKNFAFALPEIPEPTFASSYFFVLRPKPVISGPYLSWCLNQTIAQQHFKRLGTAGARMPVVTREVMTNLEVPVPDLRTQHKIVELNDLAVKQADLLAKLAEKKRTLVEAACLHASNH